MERARPDKQAEAEGIRETRFVGTHSIEFMKEFELQLTLVRENNCCAATYQFSLEGLFESTGFVIHVSRM